MFLDVIIGIFLAIILVLIGRKFNPLGIVSTWCLGLIAAAVIYVVFAIVGQNFEWVKIELLGVLFYGVMAWLALKKSVLFLSLGWALHVFWDLLLIYVNSEMIICPE